MALRKWSRVQHREQTGRFRRGGPVLRASVVSVVSDGKMLTTDGRCSQETATAEAANNGASFTDENRPAKAWDSCMCT